MQKVDFTDKTVLITGASTGIGRALAVEFAKRGARLALGALPAESHILEEVARNLESTHGARTWFFPIDLTEKDGPEELHDAVTRAAGPVDVLVNNAGIAFYGAFAAQSAADMEKTVAVNLLAPMRLMRLFIPDMVKRGQGMVFNTSSVSALQPTPFHTVYGATKAALQSLSQGVRAELKGTGVAVCTLNPPYTDTRILESAGFPEKLRWFSVSGIKRPEWIAKKAIRAFEKRRFLYIPGINAWLFHIILVRFSPRRLVDFVSGYFLQRAGRSKGEYRTSDKGGR